MDGGPISARGKVSGREAIAINPYDAVQRAYVSYDLEFFANVVYGRSQAAIL